MLMSYMIGAATQIEENVPTITPSARDVENPLIVSPPNIAIESNTTNVVQDVLTDLASVLLIAVFMFSLSERLG